MTWSNSCSSRKVCVWCLNMLFIESILFSCFFSLPTCNIPANKIGWMMLNRLFSTLAQHKKYVENGIKINIENRLQPWKTLDQCCNLLSMLNFIPFSMLKICFNPYGFTVYPMIGHQGLSQGRVPKLVIVCHLIYYLMYIFWKHVYI